MVHWTVRRLAQEGAQDVPWYRKVYRGAAAQHRIQAGWGISLVILFVAIPVIGGVVQKRIRDDRLQAMLESNSAERETFLRELYDLNKAAKDKEADKK